MRLGQRIIHLLSTPTHSGIAYEIDMRLRPSGNSGMLVASLTAFEKYQHQGAWTWEHQALVRSRVVAGDPNLAADFDKVRDQVLRQTRDTQSLATEVQQMRKKMRKHLGRGTKDGKFSLKQGTGPQNMTGLAEHLKAQGYVTGMAGKWDAVRLKHIACLSTHSCHSCRPTA